MPRQLVPGQQGRKGNTTQGSEGQQEGLYLRSCLYCISQGPGNRNHTFQPLSICSGSARFSRYASRTPSPEISGGRGVRATTEEGSEGRPLGLYLRSCFFILSGSTGNGNRTFQPLPICYGPARFSRYASRAPVPEIPGSRGIP